MSNVRSYTDEQLLKRVMNLKGFQGFPTEYWLIGVRSNEDAYNEFDDKFYLFKRTQFVDVFTGTTNPGAKALKEFYTYNDLGTAVLKGDTIVYNSHKKGLSKGRLVFRQVRGFPYYRDNDKDERSEEIGKEYDDIIYAHIHDVKMGNVDEEKRYINGWSLACQVMNNGHEWYKFMEYTDGQEFLTYCLLNEFDPDSDC